ncbi:MAG: phage portal protein [Victivallales bacterium]
MAARKTRKTTKTCKPCKTSLPVVRARYDANVVTEENAAHWSMATLYDADTEASPEVRRDLRKKARYEEANNSWLRGIVCSYANDVIGTGPRLQITDGKDGANRTEEEFSNWMKHVRLAEKLHCAIKARIRDGEVFLVLIRNPRIPGGVQLDIQLLEADRVANPFFMLYDERNIDGVILDEYGNPAAYQILKRHPGNSSCLMAGTAFTTVKAEYVIHLFRMDRPEQHRGIPEIAPSLVDCAILRRYTRAMVKKMETSANITGVMETDIPIDDEEDDDAIEKVETWHQFALPRDSILTLPNKHKLNTLNMQTPTDSQSAFAQQIKIDAGRNLNVPRNVALGDSSNYNYASGRMDFQEYDKTLRIEHNNLELAALDKIFRAWFREYTFTAGASEPPRHIWFWDGREHVDPGKEANAAETNLANATTNLAEIWGKRGRDWEIELEQRVKELAKEEELKKKYRVSGIAERPEKKKQEKEEPEDETDEI